MYLLTTSVNYHNECKLPHFYNCKLPPALPHSIYYHILFVLLKYFSKHLEKRDLHNNLEHSVYTCTVCSTRQAHYIPL